LATLFTSRALSAIHSASLRLQAFGTMPVRVTLPPLAATVTPSMS
jgi:hypothetical protein